MNARLSRFSVRTILLAGLGSLAIGTAALAHHGWEWADEKHSTLEGTIRAVYVGPPHPTLKVETASDGMWDVDLANPRQTATAGFGEGSAQPGNKVVILGNRSKTNGQKLIKAVKITVEGKDFVLYPERMPK